VGESLNDEGTGLLPTRTGASMRLKLVSSCLAIPANLPSPLAVSPAQPERHLAGIG
jgi:hypothetical protein